MLEKLKAKLGDLQNQIDTIKATAETEERDISADEFTKIAELLDKARNSPRIREKHDIA